MSVQKKITTKTVSVIEFTEEEVEELGLRPDWNYSLSEDNGKILLVPYKEVEIEFESFDKKTLIYLIEESVEKDISINEVVSEILQQMVDRYKPTDNQREFEFNDD